MGLGHWENGELYYPFRYEDSLDATDPTKDWRKDWPGYKYEVGDKVLLDQDSEVAEKAGALYIDSEQAFTVEEIYPERTDVRFGFYILKELPYYLIPEHSDWQATNKSNWSLLRIHEWHNSAYALIMHSMIYTMLSTAIMVLIGVLSIDKDTTIFIVFGTLLVSHIIIDSRIPVKKIMKLKGMTEAQINDYQNYGFMHIGIDHRLHEAVLVGLAFFV